MTTTTDIPFLCNVLFQIQSLYELEDHVEVQLLHRIALFDMNKNHVRIKEILTWTDLASYATLHTYVQSLQKKGLVDARQIFDKRAKYLFLTKKGHRFYSEIGLLLKNAIAGKSDPKQSLQLMDQLNSAEAQ